MNRDNAELIASLVDRITKIEKVIFKLEDLKKCDSFNIIGHVSTSPSINYSVDLNSSEIPTAIFTQDIVQLYIDTLNLELIELVKKLESDF